ncbi:MAG: hypothetical protein KGL94_01960 [Acidobacteriota bacterium]|nr:hypothetical protein [Acidobacteriota bacterium]
MLRRRSRSELPPLAEEEVYARSYGERSDEVTNVKPREPEPEPERPTRMSDRTLRDAFRSRLEQRDDD